MGYLRRPHTTQERRWAIEGWNRPRRSNHNLPEAWDDIVRSKPQRSWKKHRKTQYRLKVMKKTQTIKQEYRVDPEQGLAALLAVMVPPKGYEFVKMDRKGTRAIVTYKLIAVVPKEDV